MSERHLLTVWNPAYQDDALGLHVELLLEQHRAGVELGVWWGLVRSRSRNEDLPHIDLVLALDDEISTRRDENRELQLFLTDYRSLYVGDVARIERTKPPNIGSCPRYYADNGFTCEGWLYLEDIRTLVRDDFQGTLNELRKLSNVLHENKPVSIYGGIREVPLIVTRADEARYFDLDERDALADGKPWVVADTERSGVGEMMKTLREDVLGAPTWDALSPQARIFIATAEELYRTHRNDLAFDFSPVLVQLAKGIEVECRRFIRPMFAGAPPSVASMSYNGEIIDLRESPYLSLGQVVYALIGEAHRSRWILSNTPGPAKWFINEGAAVIDELAESRNPSAHTSQLSLASAKALRNRWFGIGGEALLARFVQAVGSV